jgi:hypothetical protein
MCTFFSFPLFTANCNIYGSTLKAKKKGKSALVKRRTYCRERDTERQITENKIL